MPTFFARRYVRHLQAVGPIEKTLAVVLPLLLAAIIYLYIQQVRTNRDYLFNADETQAVATATPTPANRSDSAAGTSTASNNTTPSPFPDPGNKDWRSPGQISRYTPDNLYVKIDGRVDLYLQYQVAAMTFGVYSAAADDQQTIDVYWYDMGKPENALGIYRAEFPEDSEPLKIGQAGYAVGGAIFFIKGAHYLQILPASLEQTTTAVAMEIAKRIADSIKAEESNTRWVEGVFPPEGRIADSLEFIPEDVFGLGFLKEIYASKYNIENKRFTLFIHRSANEADAAKLVERYREYFIQDGQIIWNNESSDRHIFAGQASGVIDIVFVKGVYCGGVSGTDDLEKAKVAAERFYKHLKIEP